MSVLKEFTCLDEDCQREFDSLVAVCPYCGAKAKRAFRTPPGIARGSTTPGSAKRIDSILEREFDKQGIANFTNVGGENRVSWRRRVTQKFPGVYATDALGVPQVPIRAYMSRAGDFTPLASDPTYGFNPQTMSQDGRPWNLAGASGPGGTRAPTNEFYVPEPSDPENPSSSAFKTGTGTLPEKLAQRTDILHDARGEPEVPKGVDVNLPGWRPSEH